MKRLLIICTLGCLSIIGDAQSRFPGEVSRVLNQSKANRNELEKALNYFYATKDPLKIKVINFLIANMDIHYSSDYYWINKSGQKIPFDEFSYGSFQNSVKAFEIIKTKNPGMSPRPVRYRDIDRISGDFIIENVELAFQSWQSNKSGKRISFEYFCEYVLPYRISVEPIQNWRAIYAKKFSWIKDSLRSKTINTVLDDVANDYRLWFTNTYKIESRKEPLPRLGPLHLLNRKKGPCEDIADLEVFTLRSQGIPASIDEVPFWATSSGKHFLNVCFNTEMKSIVFDVSTKVLTGQKLAREPGKVIRNTYSKQPASLASTEDPKNIPEGFLRRTNYIDVTGEYWEAKDVTCDISNEKTQRISYACVFNFLEWRPIWWGETTGSRVVFKNMAVGAAYLPMYYESGKLRPAGFPKVVGYHNSITLKPDIENKRTVKLREQAGYLVFRPGKRYRLYFWNNSWKMIGEQQANSSTKELVFNNVPRNSLLIVLPEYYEKKERPFMILDDNKRVWL